ncbi:MAG: DUF488 domain-containing protein [Gammaproteobacteria bacterium]|nr:DUF488 domain-containing protein [Gammaproteobacteria bacterium]
MTAEPILYTVGHGSRSVQELIELLQPHGITVLVDVRSHPASRHNPDASEDRLRTALAAAGISYHWAGRQLGGLRQPGPHSVHASLTGNMQGFADYMATPEFARAAIQLKNMMVKFPTAILCAEVQPEQCHRSLISDYFLLMEPVLFTWWH